MNKVKRDKWECYQTELVHIMKANINETWLLINVTISLCTKLIYVGSWVMQNKAIICEAAIKLHHCLCGEYYLGHYCCNNYVLFGRAICWYISGIWYFHDISIVLAAVILVLVVTEVEIAYDDARLLGFFSSYSKA